MFVPVNRYIQVKIEKPEQDLDEYGIVLPDDYNQKEEDILLLMWSLVPPMFAFILS